MRLKHQDARQPAHPVNVNNPFHSHLKVAPLPTGSQFEPQSRRSSPASAQPFATEFVVTDPELKMPITFTLFFCPLILFLAIHAPTRTFSDARPVVRSGIVLHGLRGSHPAR